MSDKNGLTGRKQSYKELRTQFVGTEYGHTRLEMAVGQEKVLVINSNQLKHSMLIKNLRESDNVLVAACRDKDEDKFNAYCDALDNA